MTRVHAQNPELSPENSSKYWQDDDLVVQFESFDNRYPIPTFGEASRWDLRSLGRNPASAITNTTLDFRIVPHRWNLVARELAMATLNPAHPVLRAAGVYLKSTPRAVKTIRSYIDGFKSLVDWIDATHPKLKLSDLQQTHLDQFLIFLKSEKSLWASRNAIGAVRTLHAVSGVLTNGGITVLPWKGKNASALIELTASQELSTPVIPPTVWWPLLRACWQYIDVFSHDIFAAEAEWKALNRSADQRIRVKSPDKLIEEWINLKTSAVPVHRMTYGRFREGDIHWTLLSLLISGGHSNNFFSDIKQDHVNRRRSRIIEEISLGNLTTAPGGLKTRATFVRRFDGTEGPWIDGFDPSTIKQQQKILRNACYVFCAALTMMRDSELLSIKKGALTTYYGAPAVTSQLRKKQRGTRLHNWWIIEPVATAIAVAEKLAVKGGVFGSTRKSHHPGTSTTYFDRHDELKKFIAQLNSLGPDSGLEQIPDFRLSPHMFRRTMAIIAGQQPDGEIALGLQLKHAARRAIANGTTLGYAAETPAWAAEFEHELQESVASKLVGYWASKPPSELNLAGAGAQRFRDALSRIEEDPAVAVGDERTLRSLLRDEFSTLRWGTINHCLGIPDQAACLKDLPPELANGAMMPNRCKPSTCGNSVVTDEHAPIWIAEEKDLLQKLKDRRMAKHNREQLENELTTVQQILRKLVP